MGNLFKFLKKIFNRNSLIIFICLFSISLFFCWDWYVRQYYKCEGLYAVYRGDKAYKKRDLQKAIDYYNKGLLLYPEHYYAWYNLGNIYTVYEDYYSAAEAYERSIENNPNFTLARMNLGIVSASKLGDFDGAIDQYNTIIDTRKRLWYIPFIFRNSRSEKKNRGLAYYNMGVAYREKSLYQDGDRENVIIYLQKSIDAYKNAARILKKDYDTRYNLALAYHLSGDYQNAGLNYCKAIYLKPMEYEAHYNLAILLKHLKMYKEAYDEIEKATILVTNGSSNSNTASYIFSILNDITKTLIVNNNYNYLIEKIDDEPSSSDITYVNGKIVATDALDRAMLKNFSTCRSEEFFKNQ